MLLHLVDGTEEHAGESYKTVRHELDAYGHGISDKVEIVALNKADALTPEQLKQQLARLKRAAKKTAGVRSNNGGAPPPVAVAVAPAAKKTAAKKPRAKKVASATKG